MPTSTEKTIFDHISKNEKMVNHPYLDIKGDITVGPGLEAETKPE